MKSNKLEAAIRAGNLDKVRELIAAGADVSTAFADGTTPIQLAARERQVTILRALAAAGADLQDLDSLDFEERLTLFFDASMDTDPDDDLMSADELSDWAQQAVAERMDPRLAAEISELEGHLCRAVRIGDVELLRERLAAGDDVDQMRPVTRDTPLTLAVQEGDDEMVRELIAAGADVNYAGFSTPLSFALPHLRLAKMLLDAGAEIDRRGLDCQTALDRALHRALFPKCAGDSPLLVRFFLEAGVHPPSAESVEGTLLMEAEYEEAWEIYQELLPHYSDDVAGDAFEELSSTHEMKEVDGGFLDWTFELRYAARQGDLDELRELLARRPEREDRDFAEEAGLALKEAIGHMDATSAKKAPQLEAARVLIEAGADLGAGQSYEKRRGSTPLAAAAESWHRQSKEAMRLLLDAGAGVDQRGSFGRTPLMYAVLVAYRHGAALEKAVPLLLEAGADPDLEDKFGHTAWTLARAPLVEEEERRLLGEAFRHEGPFFDGPDLSDMASEAANAADRRRDRLARCRDALEQLEAAGATPHGEAELRLVMAAAAGHAERVDELLDGGADPGARATDGKPALVAAAEAGSTEIVSRLLSRGCDVDLQATGGPSALEVAVRRADPGMTRLLLDAGPNLTTMAMMAARALPEVEAAGGHEVVRMIRDTLPQQLAYIDRAVKEEIASDDLYWDAKRDLPREAAAGSLERVRELLAVDDIEVDGFDDFRRTALTAACEAGRHEVVKALIEAGADVDKCNEVVGSPRSIPLAAAAIGPSAERDGILRLLLEAGADPDRPGADGRTALMHAVERDVGFFGRTGELGLSTRTLIAAGADLEIRDPYGLTAWMRALSLASSIDIEEVAQQYEAIAGMLEEAGASTDGLRDVELVWAVVAGETDQVRELLAQGADPDARRHDGATALALAVREGDHEIVRLLIDAGCDVDARQWIDRGPTAMDAALAIEDRRLVRMLTKAGAAKPPERRPGRRNRSSPLRKT